MAFIEDMQGRDLALLQTLDGREVTYTPSVGVPRIISGMLQSYAEVAGGESVDVIINAPILSVRTADVPEIAEGDVVLAVIGEYPYAEGYGDDGDLSLNPADSEILKRVRASGNPLIVVMLSGRPLLVHDQIDGFDAFVASFLPGMAGEGIADVLFGDAQPQAKLNFTWPTSSEGIGVLFELGSGLTYK